MPLLAAGGTDAKLGIMPLDVLALASEKSDLPFEKEGLSLLGPAGAVTIEAGAVEALV
jgi:hypothetical protein